MATSEGGSPPARAGEAQFITSAAPLNASARKRKIGEAVDAGAQPAKVPQHGGASAASLMPPPLNMHRPSSPGGPHDASLLTRRGSAGLTAVPIMVSASVLARRASSDWHPVPVAMTMPMSLLTRRASVDRGNTPVDALFSPNYHTPTGEGEADMVAASTSWSGDRASSSRRSSVASSSHDHSYTANAPEHGSPLATSGDGAADEMAMANISLGGSGADHMEQDAVAATADGEELVAAGTVILEIPAALNARHAADGGPSLHLHDHVSALTKLIQSTPVSDLVEAAHKAAEAALDAEFDPFLFIRHLPPLVGERPLRLPSRHSDSPTMTLVLDLDETLVHCSTTHVPNPDRVFQVTLNGQVFDVYMNQRPFLFEFLERVSQLFEVVVFTASQEIYADKLLDLLDRDRRLIKHRLFRDSCVYVQGNYLKDLNVLGRDLSQAIIIDNSPQAFGYQLWNGIPIESWYEDREDTELLKVLAFLESLVGVPDVRPLLRDIFRLHEFIQ